MAHEAPAASPTGSNLITTYHNSLHPSQPGLSSVSSQGRQKPQEIPEKAELTHPTPAVMYPCASRMVYLLQSDWPLHLAYGASNASDGLICTHDRAPTSQKLRFLLAGGAVESGVVRTKDTPMSDPRSVQMQSLLSHQSQVVPQIIWQEAFVLGPFCEQPIVSTAYESTPKLQLNQQAPTRDASQPDPRINARTTSLSGVDHTSTCNEILCSHLEHQAHATGVYDWSQCYSGERQPQHGKPDLPFSEVAQDSSWCHLPPQTPITHSASFSQDVVEANVHHSGVDKGPDQQTLANMVRVPACDLDTSVYETQLLDFDLPNLDGDHGGFFDWTGTDYKLEHDPSSLPWSPKCVSPTGLTSLKFEFEDVKAVQDLAPEAPISQTDSTNQTSSCPWKPCSSHSPQPNKRETQSNNNSFSMSGALAPPDETSLVPDARIPPSTGITVAERRHTVTKSTSSTPQRSSHRGKRTATPSRLDLKIPVKRSLSTASQSSKNQRGHPRKARLAGAERERSNRLNTIPRRPGVTKSKRLFSNDSSKGTDSDLVGLDELGEGKGDAHMTDDGLQTPPFDRSHIQSASSGLPTGNARAESEAITANGALSSMKEEVKTHMQVPTGRSQWMAEDSSNDHASERLCSSSLCQTAGSNRIILHSPEPMRGLAEYAGRRMHSEQISPSKRVKFTSRRTEKLRRSGATNLKPLHRLTVDKVAEAGSGEAGTIEVVKSQSTNTSALPQPQPQSPPSTNGGRLSSPDAETAVGHSNSGFVMRETIDSPCRDSIAVEAPSGLYSAAGQGDKFENIAASMTSCNTEPNFDSGRTESFASNLGSPSASQQPEVPRHNDSMIGSDANSGKPYSVSLPSALSADILNDAQLCYHPSYQYISETREISRVHPPIQRSKRRSNESKMYKFVDGSVVSGKGLGKGRPGIKGGPRKSIQSQ